MTGLAPDVRTNIRQFPAGFRWGVATAAYQIEGAASTDGRGPSIWDTFSRTPGRVHRGHTGDVACEHYDRYREDVKLMSDLGVGTYRFSLSWPRIQPDGSGPVNTRGLDFYDRLVDRLLAHEIEPMATLYHWDLPQVLQDDGGWTVRSTAERFAEYAAAAHDRLGDRVTTWTTLNEPWCSAFLGHGSGVHAPGIKDPSAAFAAVHHLLLGHGLATQVLKAAGAKEVSLTLILQPANPADPEDHHDMAAARLIDGLHNRIFLDPVLRGHYPEDMQAQMARFGAQRLVRDGDCAVIGTPIDLLGVNYYQPMLVSAAAGQPARPEFPGSEGVVLVPQNLPTTDMGWPIDADAFSALLLRLHRDYPGVPLMITENGAAYDDTIVEGSIDDVERIAYFRSHLRAVHTAIEAGVDLRGYLAWSFMDNFEWAYGYDKRFGLVHVDYATQERTPKNSARFYRDVMRANAV